MKTFYGIAHGYKGLIDYPFYNGGKWSDKINEKINDNFMIITDV